MRLKFVIEELVKDLLSHASTTGMEPLLEAEVEVAAASEDLEAAARRSRASALRLALFFLDFFLLLFLLLKKGYERI